MHLINNVLYLLDGAVEYLGPVNLDINLTSLQNLKKYDYIFVYIHIDIQQYLILKSS